MTVSASSLETLQRQFSSLPPGALEFIDNALRKHGNLSAQHTAFGDYSEGLVALSTQATLEIRDDGNFYHLLLVSHTEGSDFRVSVDKTSGELVNPMQGQFTTEPLIVPSGD